MLETFDPTGFSRAENEFILAHIGEPTIVALKALPAPGVNPRAIKAVFDGVQELEDLKRHSHLEWKGVDVIKQAIQVWFEQNEKWVKDARRGAPRFPSRYSYTSKGRPLLSGPGSDSGLVKTYFNKDGSRAPFAVSLITDGPAQWVPEWVANEVANPETAAVKKVKLTLNVDNALHRIECGVCGHTESFNPDSRASYNSARGRMSRHLGKETNQKDEHLTLKAQEFKS